MNTSMVSPVRRLSCINQPMFEPCRPGDAYLGRLRELAAIATEDCYSDAQAEGKMRIEYLRRRSKKRSNVELMLKSWAYNPISTHERERISR